MARAGRPSIAPEKLLRTFLLQVHYRFRSERHLMEDLQDHLLFRWCVGLDLDAPMWDVTIFTKNRTARWQARWPPHSSSRCWRKPRSTASCPTGLSRSMTP